MSFITVEITKWNLRRKIYKYDVKYNDKNSKSNSLLNLSNNYSTLMSHLEICYPDQRVMFEKYSKKQNKFKVKSEHYKHLSNVYSNKKKYLEKKLNDLPDE